jgi:DnaJ-class molecular chaperone
MGFTKKEIMTDPILKKGHVHKDKKKENPKLCTACKGRGWDTEAGKLASCFKCKGEGYIE